MTDKLYRSLKVMDKTAMVHAIKELCNQHHLADNNSNDETTQKASALYLVIHDRSFQCLLHDDLRHGAKALEWRDLI